jgi:hypothetical protein
MVQWRSRTNIDDTLDAFPVMVLGNFWNYPDRHICQPAVNGEYHWQRFVFGNPFVLCSHDRTGRSFHIRIRWNFYSAAKLTDLITPLRVSADEELKVWI